MSFRLKAAIIAAFALSATAAVTAADMSSASEAAPSVTSLPGITELNAAPAGVKPAVTFAAPREIAQPLAPLSNSDDVKADNLAALVDAQGAPEDVAGDMKCLAGAVYFESKGESLEGQLAVARVIINRAKSGRFADSLCGVVYQPGQFSFVRGNGMPSIRLGSESWREAVAIAQIAMDDSWDSKAEGALYFHARRVSPGWGKRQLAAIDNHIFYR
ncbi:MULTISPECIES: cell wall hydrolase [Sphingobium]|uniref:Hydrolase n=1 Tax=Sphingobium chungbukense TaxID=56193 RepID=A0A0M3AXF9_9SPHN|nr:MULTISPECIES: cell wall hydrolase [Sphingobium]KKW93626.1 hydrolase [Sphingobium chungbukense]PJG48103.1 cell wall hydrolase [Sphingobium sp. LB126]